MTWLRTSGCALLVAAVLLVTPSVAPADGPAPSLDVGPAHLDVADGWTGSASASPAASVTASATPIVLGGHHGAVLVVTRAAAPNPLAWSRATRDAHVDELITGFSALDGATVLRRAVTTEGEAGTPVLGLTLLRGGRVVAIRVLLFRTLTVAAAATADAADRATRAALEHAVAGLHPDR